MWKETSSTSNGQSEQHQSKKVTRNKPDATTVFLQRPQFQSLGLDSAQSVRAAAGREAKRSLDVGERHDAEKNPKKIVYKIDHFFGNSLVDT